MDEAKPGLALKRRRFWGVLGGLSIVLLVAALMFWPRAGTYTVVFSGADIYAHGGRFIFLRTGGRVVYHQTCVSVCDDAVVEFSPQASYKLDILGADRQCVLCQGVYTDENPTSTDVVGGREKLQLNTGLIQG